jgi:hypothetical protein
MGNYSLGDLIERCPILEQFAEVVEVGLSTERCRLGG